MSSMMRRLKRTEMVNVRFTRKERERMEARAVKLGYSTLSDYIRNVMQRVGEAAEPQRSV